MLKTDTLINFRSQRSLTKMAHKLPQGSRRRLEFQATVLSQWRGYQPLSYLSSSVVIGELLWWKRRTAHAEQTWTLFLLSVSLCLYSMLVRRQVVVPLYGVKTELHSLLEAKLHLLSNHPLGPRQIKPQSSVVPSATNSSHCEVRISSYSHFSLFKLFW